MYCTMVPYTVYCVVLFIVICWENPSIYYILAVAREKFKWITGSCVTDRDVSWMSVALDSAGNAITGP